MATHTTVSNHVIEYDDTGPGGAFLARLRAAVDDPKVSISDFVALAYGPENPILDHKLGLFPGRGVVTRAVFDDPRYHVLADLLGRKEIAATGADVQKMADAHTLTVGEAAQRLGVHENAVRQAIAARRLPSWVKVGKHFLRPSAVDAFALLTKNARRGPKPASALDVRLGKHDGISLRIKVRGGPDGLAEDIRRAGAVFEGSVPRWSQIAVITGTPDRQRFFLLEPADEEGLIEHHDFFVRGRFTKAKTSNNADAAVAAWRAFKEQGDDE